MFTLGHLSDIHLAPLPRPAIHELLSKRALGYLNWRHRRALHRREVLDRLVEDLLAQEPDHIAVTGDLVNIALPEEFRLARRWLDEIGGPQTITVIPGNHDAYVPFLDEPGILKWQPYMLANGEGLQFADRQAAHGFPFVRVFGEIALICLSSARATMPGMASGRLGHSQISHAAELLTQLGQDGYCRIVLIHHPPLPGMTPWIRALHDAPAFQKVLIECGAELVLHGHNHRVMMVKLHAKDAPIPIIGAPSASLASDDPARSAGYNLFTIIKGGNNSWRISMRSRSFDLKGQLLESHQHLLP